MLCANGQPDRGIMDSLVLQLFFGQLGVGRGSRVNHQGFYIGNIGKQREYFKAVDEFVWASSFPPSMSKVKIDPPPCGKYCLYSA